MNKYILFLFSLVLVSCQGKAQEKTANANPPKTEVFKVQKTEAEWRKELSPMEYYVLREAGTERAFTSELLNVKAKGTYHCGGCGTPLFKSEHKFDSGTGWPSFDRAIKGNVAYDVDYKIGYARTEEHCATCGGHLGHVFPDGPKETTGKRHCINGLALEFVPESR